MGLRWHPAIDMFTFRVQLEKYKTQPTKRLIMSDIAKIYDPIGWLQPVIIRGKILIQKLWLVKAGWDDTLPDSIIEEWKEFREGLSDLERLEVPRWLQTKHDCKYEIHGFCDASSAAYAAAVYLRVISDDGSVKVNLVTSKSKVAPLKVLSIPRLELCGAELLAKLVTVVKDAFGWSSKDVTTYYWTDSTIVLAWLSSHPAR